MLRTFLETQRFPDIERKAKRAALHGGPSSCIVISGRVEASATLMAAFVSLCSD
jgi:hypothetical protein